MKRMKQLAKYILWIAAFWILSDFLIFVGLNSMYKPITNNNSQGNDQFEIYQSEATLVNGRITGVIHNSPENDISGKYLEVEVFSDQGVSLGKQYQDIGQVDPNGSVPFNIFFKQQHVKGYNLNIVDEKEPLGNLELLPNNMSFGQTILLLILSYTLIF